MNRDSVKRIVRNELNLKAFKRIKSSRNTAPIRRKRNTRSHRLHDSFKENDFKKIAFTDEIDFTLEVSINRNNHMVYVK